MSSRPGRELIDWDRNNYLRIAKMASWTIREKELLNEQRLFRRIHQLYEPITALILPESLSFQELCEHTKLEQNREITAHKVYDRADKTQRYEEFNFFKDSVWQAYHKIENLKISVFDKPVDFNPPSLVEAIELDALERFPDWMLKVAMKNQGNRCAGCMNLFGPDCYPVGDHGIPRSWGIARGGLTVLSNCVALCVPCNTAKGQKHIVAFVRERTKLLMRGRQHLV